MGRVQTTVTIENLNDRILAEAGHRPEAEVRQLTIVDALVDTGASTLSMPADLIQRLGLKYFQQRTARTTAGDRVVRLYGTARVIIAGRHCPCDVVEVADGCPVLIGQIPLEALDLIVEMRRHRLIPNPAHDGEHRIGLY
ncbi:MAG: retroviral-like aspartic protease family protein [Gemmataceae bacterium]